MLINQAGMITIAYQIRDAYGSAGNDQNRLYDKEY